MIFVERRRGRAKVEEEKVQSKKRRGGRGKG